MQGKPRRSLQEVNEARAARRQEIERRCLELDPPIIPKLLSHMQSFQAALQISFPFTDKDWDVLKPRLLAQREGAETREADFAEQLKVIQTTAVQSTLEMLLMRDPNELAENEWEQVQAPVRELLAKYAEEYINEKWEDGSHVDQDNVLHFAPDVLLNIRVKYYETLNQPNPTGGPSHSRIPLSLESMKWLYDNKVKNIAESYQKELFQCNTCDSSSRFYGFEGIIQHYAAKHTTALSLGNIVVNWRTEWPDVPPFNPSPGSGTNGRNGSSANPNDQAASVLTHGEYGPPHQVQQHPIQPGGQYSFNYASYHQEPPAYGQAENMSHREVPGGRPLVPHGFAIPNPYVPTPVVDEAFSTSQLPYTSVSASSDLHRRQLTEMAQYSRDLWNATMGIKEMPASVRIYVLIHHMSAKFEKKFGTVPDISMFQHGLNENAQMRPVRSLNGLSCKACNQNAHTTSTERKLFTLPALVNHFKLTHQEQAYASSDVVQSDWRVDMVALPESPVIESLVDSNGMDDRKFALIAEPFTDVFPLPLPILSHFKESRAKEKAARIRLQNLQSLDIVPPGNAHHQRHPATTNRSSKTNSSRVSVERLPSRSPLESDIGTNEPPREDEYDPSRPLFIGDIVEHTGRRRSAGLQTTANIVLPPGIISLGVVDSHGQPENTRTQGGYDDRLLRHHRRLVRRPTEYETPRQEVYPVHQSLNPSSVAVNVATDVVAVDRFLNDLSPTAPTQHNRNAYISNTYSSVRDMNPRRFDDHSVQPLTRESIHTYSPPRYAEPLSSYQDSVPVQDQRYISQSYIDPVYYSGVPPPERRWEPHPSHQAQVSHAFAGRDRSRSPRRSVTREYIGYDPNVPQHPYQERHDVRWRGESPPRGEIYRGHNENSYGERSGDSFVGRDAQGRNVRYIAVPVDEYESQTERHHHPVRAPLPESIQYIGRSSTLMENGAGERFYMVDNRGPLRHNVDPAEDRYREYR